MPSTVSYLELVWSAISAIGLFWCWWLFHDAMRARHYWESQGLNGMTDVITRDNLRSAGVRMLVQLIFLSIGVVAMAQPPRPPDLDSSWLQILPVTGLVIANIALVIDAVMSHRRRNRMIAIERRRVRQMQTRSQTNDLCD